MRLQTNDISDLQLTNIKTTALIYKDKYLPILKGDLKINVSIIEFSSILNIMGARFREIGIIFAKRRKVLYCISFVFVILYNNNIDNKRSTV